MRMIFVIAWVLSGLLTNPVFATTWHVEPDSTGQVINIQAGIDSAAAGDTVLVAAGTYIGDGNWDLDFNGISIVVMSNAGATIGSYTSSSAPHIGFHFHNGEDTTAVVEGFNFGFIMPAILIEGSSPTIRNNHIAGEIGPPLLFIENSSAIIESNEIEIVGWGGIPIHCRYSNSLIESNEIRTMTAEAIFCEFDSSTISNNTIKSDEHDTRLVCIDSHNIIRGNEFGSGGNSIKCRRGSYEISDNTISGLWGEGIVCDSCNTVIYNNRFIGGWKGLIINGGSHTINNNSFTGIRNSWASGYGIGVSFLNIDSSTVFTNNYLYANGEGIRCSHASPLISDNVIINHRTSSGEYGFGGIHCENSSPLIIRNTIAYNTAYGPAGSGISCFNGSPRIENCIIAYNDYLGDPSWGYGIFCEGELSAPTIINCNVYGNEGGNYGGIPDQTGINGNFSLAPIFCDPENQEFTLHALSPCLPENNPYGPGAGLIGALGMGCDYVATLLQCFNAEYDNSSIEINWTVSDAVDISNFELYRSSAPDWQFLTVNDLEINGDGTSFTCRDTDVLPGKAYKYRVFVIDDTAARVLFETDRIDVPALPLTLNQNFPNPFNPSTRITYFVPSDVKVTLDIYDVSGRLVTRLVDDVQETGTHSIDWNGANSNGSNVSSGTYFYRLSAGKEVISKKMVLLK